MSVSLDKRFTIIFFSHMFAGPNPNKGLEDKTKVFDTQVFKKFTEFFSIS